MSIKMYAAIVVESQHEILDGKHITVAFSDVLPTDKLHCLQAVESLPILATVADVEYWEHADITVALFDPATFEDVKGVFENAGFTYQGYEFRPHITLGSGNIHDENAILVGKCVTPVDTYIRLKEFF